MYGIFAYIYHKNQPNVGKYTIHGSYGIVRFHVSFFWGVQFISIIPTQSLGEDDDEVFGYHIILVLAQAGDAAFTKMFDHICCSINGPAPKYTIPNAPCMEYLPTFTINLGENVGTYSIHGAYGYD